MKSNFKQNKLEKQVNYTNQLKKVTCFYRYSGICKNCKEDYDISHHPNNYDCKRYMEMPIYNVIIKNDL